MAIRITDECVIHALTILCDTCGGGWSYTIYERHGYAVQPPRSTHVDYNERCALVLNTRCACGGSYQAGEHDVTWEYSFYVCPTCGQDAEEQYAMGAYAGLFCETPGCPDAWDNAPFVGKDRSSVDWLDAGEHNDADDNALY